MCNNPLYNISWRKPDYEGQVYPSCWVKFFIDNIDTHICGSFFFLTSQTQLFCYLICTNYIPQSYMFVFDIAFPYLIWVCVVRFYIIKGWGRLKTDTSPWIKTSNVKPGRSSIILPCIWIWSDFRWTFTNKLQIFPEYENGLVLRKMNTR